MRLNVIENLLSLFTLYSIQQDDKFTTLQEQNQKLMEENVQLRERLTAIEVSIKDLKQR